jgi:hypothetical protein
MAVTALQLAAGLEKTKKYFNKFILAFIPFGGGMFLLV